MMYLSKLLRSAKHAILDVKGVFLAIFRSIDKNVIDKSRKNMYLGFV